MVAQKAIRLLAACDRLCVGDVSGGGMDGVVMTTIITFLAVFLIQNTQNRDAKGIHLKLDELIKATSGARNDVIDLDVLSDEQLKHLEQEYKRLCEGNIDERSGDVKARQTAVMREIAAADAGKEK